jgi:hypothetical protein
MIVKQISGTKSNGASYERIEIYDGEELIVSVDKVAGDIPLVVATIDASEADALTAHPVPQDNQTPKLATHDPKGGIKIRHLDE